MTKTILTAAVAALVAILAGIHAGLIVAAILAFYFLSLEIDRQIKKAKTRLYKWIAKKAGIKAPAKRASKTRKAIRSSDGTSETVNAKNASRLLAKAKVKSICAECAGGQHIWCHGKCDCDNPYHAEEAIRHEQAEKERAEQRKAQRESQDVPF